MNPQGVRHLSYTLPRNGESTERRSAETITHRIRHDVFTSVGAVNAERWGKADR
jgi:hypothetical protein